MDLDNTLWGGVICDDGLTGLVLGQGSALGEAFVDFQDYARELSRRGVILAVCSKNDEANAVEPFDKHPEMVLKRQDIATFVANWRWSWCRRSARIPPPSRKPSPMPAISRPSPSPRKTGRAARNTRETASASGSNPRRPTSIPICAASRWG